MNDLLQPYMYLHFYYNNYSTMSKLVLNNHVKTSATVACHTHFHLGRVLTNVVVWYKIHTAAP